MIKFDAGANIGWVGIIPPNAAIQEIKTIAANRPRNNATSFKMNDLIAIILPAKTVVRPNTHGIHQADGPPQRAHILAGTASGKENPRTRAFAQKFQPVAKHFDA